MFVCSFRALALAIARAGVLVFSACTEAGSSRGFRDTYRGNEECMLIPG